MLSIIIIIINYICLDKADKLAEIEKNERQIQLQQEREDEMRVLALRLRRRQRELRHKYGKIKVSKMNEKSGETIEWKSMLAITLTIIIIFT